MKKIKIDFRKLLCEEYYHFNIDIGLEMVNWFLAKGLEGDYEVQYGWNRSGINQLLYGYSANNENEYAPPFPIIKIRDFLTSIFVRAVVSSSSWDGKGKIAEWRKNNKIGIDKWRYFYFPEKTSNCPRSALWRIADYEGKELKKNVFWFSEYPSRTRPKIIGLTFSTYGKGYFVEIMFSFWEFNYELGWKETIAYQKPGEYIGDFLVRAEKILKRLTINTDATKRLAFETKYNFITFSKKNCSNCNRLEKTGNKYYCSCMEFHEGRRVCEIDNPNDHLCDEWGYRFPPVEVTQ